MAQTTAVIVAKWFIIHAQSYGDLLTNLKVQKLTYYAQAWYLALNNSSLYDDEIQAWVHGPVIPSVYREFSQFGWTPININPSTIDFSNLGEIVTKHLQEIYQVFGVHSAYELENMTHQEQPWIQARGNLDIDDLCSTPINLDNMKSYYQSLMD